MDKDALHVRLRSRAHIVRMGERASELRPRCGFACRDDGFPVTNKGKGISEERWHRSFFVIRANPSVGISDRVEVMDVTWGNQIFTAKYRVYFSLTIQDDKTIHFEAECRIAVV
jgi:hypothetical protein